MWSKRRKRFRRHYDFRKHAFELLRNYIQTRIAEALSRALEDAIINGEGGPHERNNIIRYAEMYRGR